MKTNINLVAIIAFVITSLTSCNIAGQSPNGVPLQSVTEGWVPKSSFVGSALAGDNKLWDAFGNALIEVAVDYNGDGVADSYIDADGMKATVAMSYNQASSVSNSSYLYAWVNRAGQDWVHVKVTGYSRMKFFNYNPLKTTPNANQQSAVERFAAKAEIH